MRNRCRQAPRLAVPDLSLSTRKQPACGLPVATPLLVLLAGPQLRERVGLGPAQQPDRRPRSRVARANTDFGAVGPDHFDDRQDVADLGRRPLAAVLLFDRLHLSG